MALLKMGPLIAEAVGKVGGTVFARNRYGRYARAWQKPVNPNTLLQQDRRAALTVTSQTWKILGAGSIAQWNSYAALTPTLNRLGESITLSGFNWYSRAAMFQMVGGGSPTNTTAPSSPGMASIPNADDFTIINNDGDLTIELDNPVGIDQSEGSVIAIWISPSISAGVKFYKGPWQLAFYGDSDSVAGVIALTPAVPPEIGDSVFIQMRQLTDQNRISSLGTYGPFIVEAPAP